MIQAVLIFNNKGLPRLSKFYTALPTPHLQQLLIAEIFSLVSKRPSGSCNFLEGSKMLGGDDVRIIYRHYATLYFVFVVEESESELGILDLIQVSPPFDQLTKVFVESLDRSFPNVCELDLVYFTTVSC
jgi:AP-3 complex subunit sigma